MRITTGTLWSVWLQQDAANIAVYLPRNLNLGQFAGFALFIIAGLGLLFFQRGERIQQVVDEKSQVTDVRAATIIDLIYAFILWYFKIKSKVPMSTTWVFIGLLGGRELAMSLVKANEGATVKDALMGKDVMGIVLAVAINDVAFVSVHEGSACSSPDSSTRAHEVPRSLLRQHGRPEGCARRRRYGTRARARWLGRLDLLHIFVDDKGDYYDIKDGLPQNRQ